MAAQAWGTSQIKIIMWGNWGSSLRLRVGQKKKGLIYVRLSRYPWPIWPLPYSSERAELPRRSRSEGRPSRSRSRSRSRPSRAAQSLSGTLGRMFYQVHLWFVVTPNPFIPQTHPGHLSRTRCDFSRMRVCQTDIQEDLFWSFLELDFQGNVFFVHPIKVLTAHGGVCHQ